MGDETFGIIANSKNEDAIIFEVGDAVYEEIGKKKKKMKKKLQKKK
ncbi:MAG: hypothetical protein GY823_10130 [Flavobacteriaceae bacterium]|nr:hypothetical protein [Flavobacteriaceae bacterium]